MRIRDWDDLLSDVTDRDVAPDEWRAVAGARDGGVGEDAYLAHPSAGVYLLKTYAKSPYEVRGYGTRVARRLDDEIGSFLPERDADGRFAVGTPPEDEEDVADAATRLREVLAVHADAPTTPEAFFEDVMEAIESPAFGPMEYDGYGRPDELDDLADRFDEAEELLAAELDDLVETDGVGRGFL